MPVKKGFASDNGSGVHPDVLRALAEANAGHAKAYGDDPWTEAAVARFREHFGPDVDVCFVFNGSGANVVGLAAATESHHAVICAETAHVQVDECGALEKFGGCKVLTVPAGDGKITVEGIRRHVQRVGDVHHSQARVVSITQPTEYGTVYEVAELREIAAYVHANDLLLHMDGARLSNAAAALGVPLRALTADVGVDVLSFGGTKNGLMYGEAVVLFDRSLSRRLPWVRKQGLQLASKMRFIAAQFDALLSNDLWLRNASWANRMAQLLLRGIESLPTVRLTQKVQVNALFAILPPHVVAPLQAAFPFYVWNDETSEVRWMTTFDTSEQDVLAFVERLRQLLA